MRSSRTHRTSGSLYVFRAFMTRNADGSLDANGVISRDCYLTWLKLKGVVESDEQAQKFRRTLTNHVSGTDGRCPLEPEEEAALLVLFRRKQSWPCFPRHLAFIGKRYRSRGYHEVLESKLRVLKPLETSPQLFPVDESLPVSPDSIGSVQSNVHDILSQLSLEDAKFLTQLGEYVAENADDCIYEVMRFTILGRTALCRTSATREDAQRLCSLYSSGLGAFIAVMDMAAKCSEECIVVQNQASADLFGDCGNRLWQQGNDDEPRLAIAICAAYHVPGRAFALFSQEIFCWGMQRFDMTFTVDPCTFLLVVRGEESFSIL